MAGVERIIHGIHGTHKHSAKKEYKVADSFKASAAQSGERKAAERFAQMIDGRSFQPHMFAHFFGYEGMESQFAMFEIMINMIDHWADLYRSGEVDKTSNPKVLGICRWADRVQQTQRPR